MMWLRSVKTHPVKYLFLAFNVFQWIAAGTLIFRLEDYGRHLTAALVMAFLGLILYLVFLVAGRKVKNVVIRKDKVIVAEAPLNIQFEWSDVQAVRLVPFVNAYRLRIRGRKKSIWFLPSQHDGHGIRALKNYLAKPAIKEEQAIERQPQPAEEYSRVAI